MGCLKNGKLFLYNPLDPMYHRVVEILEMLRGLDQRLRPLEDVLLSGKIPDAERVEMEYLRESALKRPLLKVSREIPEHELWEIDRKGVIEELKGLKRRFWFLRRRAAQEGIRVDPSVMIEIQDIERRIAEFQK